MVGLLLYNPYNIFYTIWNNSTAIGWKHKITNKNELQLQLKGYVSLLISINNALAIFPELK